MSAEQGGATGAAQDLANQGVDTAQSVVNSLVDAAQQAANGVVDLSEEAAGAVLQGLLTANRLIGEALEKASSALPKPSGQ